MHDRPSTLRGLSLPVALSSLGIACLIGCIPIPAPRSPTAGRDASLDVGSEDSRRQLRVADATKPAVLKLLGEPYFTSDDGRSLAYAWSVRNGYAVWPLCFQAFPINGDRTLVLRFDEHDVLRSYEALKRDDPLVTLSAMSRNAPLPADLLRERQFRSARESREANTVQPSP